MGTRQKYKYTTGKRYNCKYNTYIYPKNKGQAYQEGNTKGIKKLLNKAINRWAT